MPTVVPSARQGWLLHRRTRVMYPPTTPIMMPSTLVKYPPVIRNPTDIQCIQPGEENFYQLHASGTNITNCPMAWYISNNPTPPDWVFIDQRTGLLGLYPPPTFRGSLSFRVRCENCVGINEVDVNIAACITTYIIYVGNDAETKRTVYTEADVTGWENSHGQNVESNSVYGQYEIGAPMNQQPYYRAFAFPDQAVVGVPMVFYSPAAFKVDYEVVQTGLVIGEIPYTIYRSVVRSAGAMDTAHGNPITISAT